jgi:hypothetical protein
MPLTKQKLDFAFRGGVSTKDDPKGVPPAKLLALTNGVFTAPGRIQKRNGFGLLGRRIAVTDELLDAGQALMTYRGELLTADTSDVYSYNATSREWVAKGGLVSCVVSRESVAATSYSAIGPDGATHSSGLQAFVWNAASTGLYYSIVDSATGQTVVAPTLISAVGVRGRVIVSGNLFLFYFYNTTTTLLYVATLPVGDPTRTLSPVVLTTSAADANSVSTTYPIFDVARIESDAVGPQIYLAFNNRLAGGGTSLWRFPVTAVSTPATNGKVTITGDAGRALAIFRDRYLDRVVLAYWNGTAVWFRTYEPALANASDVAQLVAFGVIETSSSVLTITGESVEPTTDPTFATGSVSVSSAEGAACGVIVGGVTVTTPGSQLVGATIDGTGVSTRWTTSDDASATAVAAAINASGVSGTVGASAATNVVTITADTAGAAGNSILLAAIGTGVTASGATLTGGSDQVQAWGKFDVLNASGMVSPDINGASLLVAATVGDDVQTAADIAAAWNADPVLGITFLATSAAGIGAGATVTITFLSGGIYDGTAGNGFACSGIGTGITANTPTTTGGADLATASGTITLSSARGLTDAQVASNLATAIAADGSASALVTPSANSTTITLAARSAGTAGNLSLAATGTGRSVSGAAMTGGTDPADLRFYWTTVAVDPYDASAVIYTTRTASITGGYRVSALGLSLGVPYCEITGTAADFLRSVSLAGKAFTYEGAIYVPLVFPSTLQPTYFLANGDAEIVSRMLATEAGPVPSALTGGGSQTAVGAPLAGVSAVDSTSFLFPCIALRSGGSGSGSSAYMRGVEAVTLDFFEPERSYQRAELAQNLHVSGGFVSMYDGIGVVEHGFHLYPETLALTSAAGSGKTYSYLACYEWNDNRGNLHRSAPSTALTVQTTNAVAPGDAVTIAVPTLRLTAKRASATPARTPVRLVLYRTTDGGTTYYRSALGSAWLNDTTADHVVITDTTEDADLTEPIYTNGGVVENIAAPTCTALVVHRSRLFALVDGRTWWYSKQVVEGSPVEFSDLLTLAIDAPGGGCVAGASLDDKFVAFTESRIFYFLGEGPDSTGAQDSFSDAQPVNADVGCTNPRSIVTTPAGILFKSAKGIYLLDRSLAVTYIGADVEAYNADTITSAVLLESTNQVRFTLDSGVALVFDYFAGQWSVFTNIAAVDSVIWSGEHVYLRDDGSALEETPGVFTDAGSFIPLSLKTAWLQFAGQQGYQRVYKAMVLGEYRSDHTLKVDVAVDFNPTPVQSATFTVDGPDAYGDDATYGSGSPYGGTFPRYQYRVRLTKQKSEAVQITVSDVQNGTPGESMSLSGLAFEIGRKVGLYKTPTGAA